MSAGPEWGPLARLAGIWEGDKGEDVAFGNVEGKIITTPFREHVDFKPFGPVENGTQVLYGLDYRMAAWRGDEENPFHTGAKEQLEQVVHEFLAYASRSSAKKYSYRSASWAGS